LEIPVCAPKIEEIDVEYVSECVRSGWISGISGYVSKFEDKFAKYCECKYGIAVNSGTTALQVALAAVGVSDDDEVIIPTFTMIATPNSVVYQRAKPVLVDSEIDAWNIDVDKIEDKITKKTKAIIPVHTYGHPVDMAPLLDIADKYDLYVIEDAAEAHGAEYNKKRAGSLGDAGCFSFYANKIITTGEGGMIVTNDEELAEKAAWLRAHAFGKEGKHFFHEALGFGYRMSGMQAALGLAQMERIEKFVEARRERAKKYNSILSDFCDVISLPPEASWAKNVYWMYSILLDQKFPTSREIFMKKLERKGIETRTFFYPVHVQPLYESLRKGNYPIADELAKKGINLPSGNDLTLKDVEMVCNTIIDIVK